MLRKALFIGYLWPEPKTTAAGHRMLQLLECFMANNYKLVFASTAQKTSYTANLYELGIATAQIQLNHNSFNDFIIDLKPDVVVFDRFMIEEQFGWRVAEFAPNAIRILNTEDLHSLRSARQSSIKTNKAFTNKEWLGADITKREIASIYRSDLTLLISKIETELLKSVFHISEDLLVTLPFLLDTVSEKQQSKWPRFEERQNFVFIGNGRHAPNVDAIKYLKSDIWPLIHKELPNTKLNIYGAYLPQHVNELHKPSEGFFIHGWIEELDTVLQETRVNLAPLRFGAGIKGKIIDGLKNGTPTVTTGIGAEGITDFTTSYDNPIAFAKNAVALYNFEKQWIAIQQQNSEILRNNFSKEKLAPYLFKIIDNIKRKLDEHRYKNFIGSVLQHQTMASTKFMSKWIEEKNKKK
ncbi:glycosyltransferase [uncultured Croceitalea sp.]|uniref:glycosyltransferase family 4 protein n=1 Tax=uncultured Croceitalea sp. TaxID=1798908 RepID=UPI0033061EC0